jgi:site-specific DNA recombinase
VLLVYRVDRLTRSLRDLVTMLDVLDQAGVMFRSATEPFDTATPMGRMLVQMLGMFAQFERDTIIDRVIAGMERKAAAGKWKGGRRPFGYQVDTVQQALVPDTAEAALVRLIFDSYTRDRLGARTIATLLNERGHRTTTGGRWSAHQVVRVLSNRIYLGELTFRGITATGCHPPVIEQATFEEAQRILAARADDRSKRAASGSDYLLTGLIRCAACGSAMLGTRAHGKTKTYRYYSCYRRTRYDTEVCGGQRIDADAIEHAVTGALADLYRHQRDLIGDAIAAAQHSRAADQDGRRGELAAAEHELARTGAAIDRYLAAFENGTLDPEDLASRLAALNARTRQLTARRDELAIQLDAEPGVPPSETLIEVADHIDEVIASGTHSQRKALIETLVAQVKITGPGRIVPVFRIPQATCTEHSETSSKVSGVRAMTNLVGQVFTSANDLREGLVVAGLPTG